ncbi:MAG: VWA domain-containing protein [Flavobacteriaceae bacterium]|nr:VWA domain-containing protein [Flavobacteriaceae bacterium]
MISNFEFSDPWFLLLLLVIPALIIWHLAFRNLVAVPMKIPSIKAFDKTTAWYKYISTFLFILRLIAISLLIIALARPRKVDVSTRVQSDKGVDIMMVVDVSLSMLARDLKPTRLAALQEVAEEFVTQRRTDRIGLIEYSGEAITKVPLTTDRAVVIDAVRNLQMDELEAGTAIGIGVATAVNHLQHSKAESKVILLISDGGESPVDYTNHKIYISPENAADIAKDREIKIYAIGIGTTGIIPLPRGYEHYPQSAFQLDENLMKHIAQTTNGRYFRATDNQKLEEIYNEINQLEKTEISEIKYYNYTEYFRKYIFWALAFICIEIICKTLIFRQLT